MTRHYARLIVVAVSAVSFSTPITGKQEPPPPTTSETLLETVGQWFGQWLPERSARRFEVTDSDLALLAQSTEGRALDGLYLGGSQITDSGLVYLTVLPELLVLDLSDTKVTDAGLVHLSGLPKLDSLTLYSTGVTAVGIAGLRKALPSCGDERFPCGIFRQDIYPPPPPPSHYGVDGARAPRPC